MKGLLCILIISLIAIGGALAPASAELVPDEVIVTFKPGIALRDQTRLLRSTMRLRTRRMGFGRAFVVVQVPKGSTAQRLIQRLEARPEVLYAEQNVRTQATAAKEPNDLFYSMMQWSLQSVEFGTRVDKAWSISTGAGEAVAVLDTGCAYATVRPFYAAPDLDPDNIIPMTDWVNLDLRPSDDNGHGTFLCTLIAAKTNNRIGGAGIAPDATLMVGKVLDSSGNGRADWLASGINEAAARGAGIILIGCGMQEHSRVVQEAIDDAVSRGAVVVMGAGNDGVDLDLHPEAHAIYEGALVVAATTRGGGLASYSNYGSVVDLVAPGGAGIDQIWSQTFSFIDPQTVRYGFRADGNSIASMSGTSVAAAHVAGVLALAKAAGRGGNLSASARMLTLTVGGRPRNFPLIDAAAAVGYQARSPGGGVDLPASERVVDVSITRFSVPGSGVTVGSRAAVQVEVTNIGTESELLTVEVRDTTGDVALGSQTVSLSAGQSASLDFTWVANLPLGSHNLVAEAKVPSDADLTNNVRTASAEVVARPLTLLIGTYNPDAGDPSRGTPQTTFRGGSNIGLEFNVAHTGAPAPGATVNYTVIGASGQTVGSGSLVTDGGGRATATLAFYYIAGGPGTYRVEATATYGQDSVTESYTFQVTSARSGR